MTQSNKHSVIKTALGVGLLAASLGSYAAAIAPGGMGGSTTQSFADAMLFYKATSTGLTYMAFIPTGRNSGDMVLALELTQPLTGSNTWTYAAEVNAIDAAAGGPVWSVKYDPSDASWYDSRGDSQASDATPTAWSFFGGGSAAVELGFVYSTTVSSQACIVTYTAQVNTNGDLFMKDIAVAVSGASDSTMTGQFWNASGNSYTVAASSIDSDAFNSYSKVTGPGAVPTATIALTANSALYSKLYTGTTGGTASSTGVTANSSNLAGLVAAYNKCATVYNNRVGLNLSAGGSLITGGAAGGGFMRAW